MPRRLVDAVLAERDRWILWLPVLLGTGVAVYFALPAEPPEWTFAAAAVLAVAFGLLATLADGRVRGLRPLAAAALALVVGFAAAQGRTLATDTRTLQRDLGPTMVSGRVGRVEAFPDGLRLSVAAPTIAGLAADETPALIRFRLRGRQPAIRPGDVVRVRAMLMPPAAPVAPGAFDYQRQAWFEGLGAVGYSVGTAEVVEPAGEHRGVGLWFAELRWSIAASVREHVPGPAGPVTTALLIGETRAIPDDVMSAIRDSGLQHLLSISGLHIGLVAGIVLFGVRAVLALVPAIALRYPIKKWAAIASVLAAGFYTLLAAAPVPSQRSFLMIAIVLLAVLVDRQGISMRLVAWAAFAILVTQPQSLLGPSFQMSFGAVVALIAAYEVIAERRRTRQTDRGPGDRLLLYLGGVMLSTLIAGTATAPFAAYHFDRFQVYSVAANMVAVPVTGFWIMPWAIAALLLMPFGLEGLALTPLSWGVEVVIWIAREVASWPGAVVLLPAMPAWGLVLVTLGGLWLCLWWRRWRLLGLALIAAGLASYAATDPPDLLVDGAGRLVATRADDGGLWVSSKSSARSIREAWLQRSGAVGAAGWWPKEGEAAAGGVACDATGCVYRARGRTVAIARRGEALVDDCRTADVVVALLPVTRRCGAADLVVDLFDLRHGGAHALWVGWPPRVETVNGRRGDRPWVLLRGDPRERKVDSDPRPSDAEATEADAVDPTISSGGAARPADPEP